MAEESFVEHKMTNMHEMENIGNLEDVEDLENIENTENFRNMENVGTVGNVENVEDVEYTENVENVEYTENVENVEYTENVENVEYTENVETVENTENVENVSDNSHPPLDSRGAEYLPIKEEKKWPGWPGENVFRMLVPAQKVGGIIGRKGEYIKKICEETKARIKILDGPPGTTERTVMVSAKEEPDLPLSPAMVGLLTVHNRITDADTDTGNATSGGTVCTRLLVAATQAGSLIGKQGSTIKSIQDASNCIIRVLGGEHLPVFALPDDSVVEVQGEASGVHKAIEMIASQLRKFLVDRSVIGIFETHMQMPNSRITHNMAPPQSWGPPPPAFPMSGPGGGPGYGPNTTPYMPPPRQFDNYYPSGDMGHMDKPPRQVPPPYVRDTTNLQPQQSMVTKVMQNMQIPLSFADAVIGTSGSNISYIRRASGATIAIQETRGVPGEMTVEISGSASQVQAAQQLIQNCIADAATNAAKNQASAPPTQGYNPYPSHAPVYSSPGSNSAALASHAPAADYNYGPSYGY